MGRFAGFLLHHIIRFKRKPVINNLNIVYGEGKWPDGILKKIYRHMGLLFCEMLRMPSLGGEKYIDRFSLHGIENLDDALAQGKGVIIVSAHTGNWEYGISGLNLKGYKANVIVKNLKDIDNDYVFNQIRGKKGVGSILKDKGTVLNVRRALKRNEIVVMVIDQNSKRSEGVFVDHFGKPASTYLAPYVLSNRFGCPIVPVFNYRDENLKDHHIICYPAIKLEPSGDDQKDQIANTEAYIKAFEKFLMDHPEQWIWMHRRWRSQPKEE